MLVGNPLSVSVAVPTRLVGSRVLDRGYYIRGTRCHSCFCFCFFLLKQARRVASGEDDSDLCVEVGVDPLTVVRYACKHSSAVLRVFAGSPCFWGHSANDRRKTLVYDAVYALLLLAAATVCRYVWRLWG